MPLPAIIGLPALAAFLGSILVKIVEVLFSAKAIRLAVVLASTVALFAAMSALDKVVTDHIHALMGTMPPDVAKIGLLLPSNTGACIQACLGTQFACTLYSFANRVIDFKIKATG